MEFKVIIYIELGLTPGYLMKFRGSSYTSGILIGPNITKSWYFTVKLLLLETLSHPDELYSLLALNSC